jgi:hypothetical protein|tara:strand:+ start:165 stop:305 length:141 start_codon:yes stop_codon:yes gene_type:complete
VLSSTSFKTSSRGGGALLVMMMMMMTFLMKYLLAEKNRDWVQKSEN